MISINLKEIALEELVNRAQSNADDGASFTEICRRFNGLVMKYARQNHLAGVFEDAAAEGWLAVVEAVRSYDPSKGINFAGYVDSRVKYAIWNFFKKSRRRWQREVPEITSSDGEETNILEFMPADIADIASQIADKSELDEQMQSVKEAFGKISDKQQTVIQLTIIGKLKLKETAQQMGITPQAVHNLQKRGLRRLRTKLAK